MNQQKTIPADASALPVNIDDIRAAHERIAASIVRTPTLRSRALSSLVGAQVYLTFENLQLTAAYHERGAPNRLLLLSDQARKNGVNATSAGKHSLEPDSHGARPGVPVTTGRPKKPQQET